MKFLLSVAVLCLYQGTASAYKAAVVEYRPTTSDTPQNTIIKNLNSYRSFVESAKNQGVDIIVFPEYGLTRLVDDPKEYSVEINSTDDSVITELHAIALEHEIYLVVNLLERVQEPNRQTQYYNTDLVFDRKGNIILTYRKINPFGEPNITPGAENQTVTFTTDFGVKFGIFTCFDILYSNPSRTLLNDVTVTDVVFPTAWYSTVPFYSSLSVQHGYSVANGVNLLAANYGDPNNTHGGSGIYLSDGRIAETYIDETPSSKMIVQVVPNINTRVSKTTCVSRTPFGLPGPSGQSNISNYVTRKDFNAYQYQFQTVDLSQGSFNSTICDGDFCCNFDIVINTPVVGNETYKLVAFDGQVDFDRSKAYVRFCSLLVCENDAKESCGARINGTTKFTKITVSGYFPTDNETFYVPVTLNYNLQPIAQINYCDTHNGTNSTFVKLDTYKGQDGVLVFGLFGRTANAATSHFYGVVSLVFLGVLKCLLFK